VWAFIWRWTLIVDIDVVFDVFRAKKKKAEPGATPSHRPPLALARVLFEG
jgi:hypothetical protein